MQTTKFYKSEQDQPHPQRTVAILKAHPEVRTLIGRNPWTAAIMCFIVGLQVSLAWFFGHVLDLHYWWFIPLTAFCIGAFCNHTLYVIIHEATHNLIFKGKTINRWVALVADLPNLVPGSMGFVVFHLKHHAYQGDYHQDADMANEWEARLIGNSAFGKAIWLLFFPLFQVTRPARLKTINMWSKWTWINLTMAIVFDTALVLMCGWPGLIYLVCSFFFSIGLHPLGARWIQEHYTYDSNQETFSYYGPINVIALNVGYHNEHHDFPSIPWNNLPKLRAMAPEYYDSLKHHTSWTKLWLQFIFDKRFSLFSRVERIGKGKASVAKAKNATA